jgi:excisionase family DNA binding protein
VKRTTDSPDDSSFTITRATPLSDLPELLNPSEAFAWWDVGKTSGYALLRSGKIRVVRLGRQIRIPRDELQKVG